ncbi:hypothetical protein K3495_g16642 [Podosphaera aphanis]|nr:hypothetical protein K3495_g16642 [Podosphaera aphanis]
MFTAMEYWDEQRARGHSKIVEEFMKNKDNVTMVDEIQHLKDRRSMPKTWASNKNPLTTYYY